MGEGRPFPFPKVCQYKAHRTKKRSILILPIKYFLNFFFFYVFIFIGLYEN